MTNTYDSDVQLEMCKKTQNEQTSVYNENKGKITYSGDPLMK